MDETCRRDTISHVCKRGIRITSKIKFDIPDETILNTHVSIEPTLHHHCIQAEPHGQRGSIDYGTNLNRRPNLAEPTL